MSAEIAADAPPDRPAGRLLLLGAGHAHLHVIRHARRLAQHGLDVTLIDPDRFWYSGLATGMLGGMYPCELDQVDAGRLIEKHGGRFVRDRAIRIDPAAQQVHLAGGSSIGYDMLSINIGSVVPLDRVPGAAPIAWPAKPISGLCRLREHLSERFARQSPGQTLRIVVIGGGATGCELAANLAELAQRRQGRVELTLITRADRVTPAYPRGASASLARALRQRNVHIVTSCPVARVEQDAVVAEDGRRFAFDLLVAAIGLAPPPLLRESGLDVDDEGGLRVDGTLRSVSDPRIFGTGDCISLEGCRLPRLGVFGVREAPILLHNLLASFTGQRLCTYRPQRRWLTILNLGRGEALAVWGPCHWRSRASLRLKDWIDRRFLQQYQREIATLRC